MRHFTYSGNLEDAIEKAERDLQKEKENKEIAQWYWLYEKAKKAISAHNKKIANIEAFIRCAEEEQEKQKGKADIHHYFQSIDHAVLKTEIRKVIKDAGVLALLDRIIDHNCRTQTNWTGTAPQAT